MLSEVKKARNPPALAGQGITGIGGKNINFIMSMSSEIFVNISEKSFMQSLDE
jgi:hypothetical protein